MLLSPAERWGVEELPKQLKSQKSYKSKENKKSGKWAEKLGGIFQKGKSKSWQNLRELGCKKPVPNANKQSLCDDDKFAGAGPPAKPVKKNKYWKGKYKKGKSAAKAKAKVK